MNDEDLLDRARMEFPRLFEEVKTYYSYAPLVLMIVLEDGRTFLYDDLNRTSTCLPSDDGAMTRSQTNRVFGILLRKVMQRKGMTQQMLADATGLQQYQICNYTYGKSSPSLYALDKIARALGCSVEEFRYVK